MRLKWTFLAAAAMTCGCALAEGAPAFKDKTAQESYAIGAQTARTLRKDNVEINADMLIRGIRDGLGDGALLMSEKELRAIMSRVQQDVYKNMAVNRRTAGERNKEQGARYLAENGKKPGVVTTDSGLQYEIIKAGNGAKPVLSDTVLVNYRGTLTDGSEFEASEDGKPAQMIAVQTIPGWKEALQMMSTGSRWRLAVPARLAYGERGSGAEVGPHQVLLFDLELVSIKKP